MAMATPCLLGAIRHVIGPRGPAAVMRSVSVCTEQIRNGLSGAANRRAGVVEGRERHEVEAAQAGRLAERDDRAVGHSLTPTERGAAERREPRDDGAVGLAREAAAGGVEERSKAVGLEDRAGCDIRGVEPDADDALVVGEHEPGREKLPHPMPPHNAPLQTAPRNGGPRDARQRTGATCRAHLLEAAPRAVAVVGGGECHEVAAARDPQRQLGEVGLRRGLVDARDVDPEDELARAAAERADPALSVAHKRGERARLRPVLRVGVRRAQPAVRQKEDLDEPRRRHGAAEVIARRRRRRRRQR